MSRSGKASRINVKYAIAFAILLCIEIMIAKYVHDDFVRPYVGDVLIVILIYCFLKIFLKTTKHLPIWIFLFSVLTEMVQLLDLPGMLGINNKIILIIVGSTFDPVDIFCYFIGCTILCLYEIVKVAYICEQGEKNSE